MQPLKPTIGSIRHYATSQLRAAGIETAALDARLLLSLVLDLTPTEVFMREVEPIDPEDEAIYLAMVIQRAAGVPIAYLIGHREFMGLEFSTKPGVLVPRPDTEPLVEWGLDWLRRHPDANVVDIGTGSGAIAISMVAHAQPDWTGHLIATDISPDALAIATSNADKLLTSQKRARTEFRLGSLTDPIETPVDLLLTNLPYLTPVQMQSNPALSHEPRLALDGGEDGLDLVRQVIGDLPRILAPDGAVGFEIDPAQAAEVQMLLRAALPHHEIGIVHDLAGDERHVIGYARQ